MLCFLRTDLSFRQDAMDSELAVVDASMSNSRSQKQPLVTENFQESTEFAPDEHRLQWFNQQRLLYAMRLHVVRGKEVEVAVTPEWIPDSGGWPASGVWLDPSAVRKAKEEGLRRL